jgi:homoserine kinase type II
MRTHSRALLSLEEVREAARAFGLRRPIEAEPIGRGSRLSAKSRLRTADGSFMLKRRPPEPAGDRRLEFLHAFQLHLSDAGVPVPRLARTPEGRTAVPSALGTYELFEWIDGTRWSLRVAEGAALGAALGSALRASSSFVAGAHVPHVSYHRAGAFEGVGDRIVEAALEADPDTDAVALRGIVARLLARGGEAHARAERAGIAASPRLVIHGDMHPGNVLFDAAQVRALLDWDSARLDHRACEVANALVHFGNAPMAGLPESQWRVELDVRRMGAVVAGVGHGLGAALVAEERNALPWLMIESCTLESIVPVARTGRFAHLRADGFLAYIERKTAWIEAHAPSIAAC